MSKKSSNFADVTMNNQQYIHVVGARVNNLRNISVDIPRNSLTVITGLSGSGKSSLAFDTIFAEGQRRYIDTFSAYARGFLGNMTRPDVDKISGLSPVISIDQKTTNHNPRSTVGTVTEVYDYLRLLYARASTAYSYATGEEMVRYTDEQIADLITHDYAGRRTLILSRLVTNRKGHYRELFDTVRKKGFVYVRVDGEVVELVPGMKLDRYRNHTIDLVIDRLRISAEPTLALEGEALSEDRKRLLQSISKAMQQGNGTIMLLDMDTPGAEPRHFSRSLMCPTTGIAYQEPAPHNFSFNSPQGACPCCKGLGRVRMSAADAANGNENDNENEDEEDYTSISIKELMELGEAKKWDEKEPETDESDLEWVVCPECNGQRLKRESLCFRFAGKNIAELADMDISTLREWLDQCQTDLPQKQAAIAAEILKEIRSRLSFMEDVGLQYLSLNRSSDSLSGGEAQRIRLATQIGSKLVNVLYILDEPSIGLHQRDNEKLIHSLKQLRDAGNTVIVVEHDEQIMREADWIVDIGPRAGRLGGKVVFSGTPEEMLRTDTLTARYLNGQEKMPTAPAQQNKASDYLVLEGCTGNNLKSSTVFFPLHRFVCVTGVSGSGKSTLVNQTLYPLLSQHFYRSLQKPLPYARAYYTHGEGGGEVPFEEAKGSEWISKVIAVDQSPIGRTPRSNPATYTGVFTDIRQLFAALPEARIRAYMPGRFSFNARGGRCEACAGNGLKRIEMRFLPDVYVPCEACDGRRYNPETLEVRFKGKTIADVLDMTINQAVEFFEAQPTILNKIRALQEVGLGYIKLGQSATTLSGGEAQRLKLATELSRPSNGNALYILDEPTTGLHFDDIRVLLGVLRRLVEMGNSLVVIEHNLDIIRAADWLIDMGPEGGRGGGQVVATGTLKDIRKSKKSLTGKFL